MPLYKPPGPEPGPELFWDLVGPVAQALNYLTIGIGHLIDRPLDLGTVREALGLPEYPEGMAGEVYPFEQPIIQGPTTTMEHMPHASVPGTADIHNPEPWGLIDPEPLDIYPPTLEYPEIYPPAGILHARAELTSEQQDALAALASALLQSGQAPNTKVAAALAAELVRTAGPEWASLTELLERVLPPPTAPIPPPEPPAVPPPEPPALAPLPPLPPLTPITSWSDLLAQLQTLCAHYGYHYVRTDGDLTSWQLILWAGPSTAWSAAQWADIAAFRDRIQTMGGSYLRWDSAAEVR